MGIFESDSIHIPVPFALPFLGIPEPTTLSINKGQFQLFMRIVVFVCSALIFWPKIKGAFGFSSAADTEEQRKDIQERIAKIEHERGEKKGQKSYGVVTGSSAGNKIVAEKEATGTKRRKG